MSIRIVIVGGVAGGMSAATRARRMNEDASIIVLEKGGHISFANCGLPYRIGGRINSDEKLLITTPQKVLQRFNIDARVRHEVLSIDRQQHAIIVRDHARKTDYLLPYDKLILAPGASPIIPAVDHVNAPNVFLLRTMEDTARLQDWIAEKSPQAVAIVGAGFIGLEMAEAMRDRGLSVTLIEKSPHVLPPIDPQLAPWVDSELKNRGVNVITGVGLAQLHGADGIVQQVELEDGRRIAADMVLLSIGVRPNVAVAQAAGLKLGASGAIAVDRHQRTSDPDIYAVGDASEATHALLGSPVRMPLAGPANRQGRLAGEHAATGNAPAAGAVLGTAIVQVFGLSVGVTGLGEDAARKAGFDVDCAYVMPNHHAGYYPGAKQMRIKLIYDRATGRILGAQAVGEAGVDKRIDVIATAIHFKGTIDDLAELDLAYAPQFGAAKDPLHMAAMVAQNQRRALMAGIDSSALGEQVLVDVRTAEEFARGSLPRAINVPVDELRQRLDELDPASPTVTFCQVGMRGYVAQRILEQRGFKSVQNLKGGYALAAKTGRAV